MKPYLNYLDKISQQGYGTFPINAITINNNKIDVSITLIKAEARTSDSWSSTERTTHDLHSNACLKSHRDLVGNQSQQYTLQILTEDLSPSLINAVGTNLNIHPQVLLQHLYGASYRLEDVVKSTPLNSLSNAALPRPTYQALRETGGDTVMATFEWIKYIPPSGTDHEVPATNYDSRDGNTSRNILRYTTTMFSIGSKSSKSRLIIVKLSLIITRKGRKRESKHSLSV